MIMCQIDDYSFFSVLQKVKYAPIEEKGYKTNVAEVGKNSCFSVTELLLLPYGYSYKVVKQFEVMFASDGYDWINFFRN